MDTWLDISIVTNTSDEIIVEARQTPSFKKFSVGMFVLISFVAIFIILNSLARKQWFWLGIVLGVWGLMLVATIFVFSVKVIVLDKKEEKMVILRRFKKGDLGRVGIMVPLEKVSHFKDEFYSKRSSGPSYKMSVVFKDSNVIRLFMPCDVFQAHEVIQHLNRFLEG